MNRELYDQQFAQFCQMCDAEGIPRPNVADQNAILTDDRPTHDEVDFSLDYFVHCSWIARKIAEVRPKRHVDCGSYCYLAGIVSAFIEQFEFIDIRPLPNVFPNLISRRLDMTHMPEIPDGSVESLSSGHVIEHMGLGRYGDRINPVGDRWAANELKRILAPGGRLIIVLPMNENPSVCFNAHRFYSLDQVRALFSGLAPVSFEYIYGDRICSGRVPQSGHYTGLMVFAK